MLWEERFHPLRQEWVVVAAHRQERPWSGEMVRESGHASAPYVADCYLCPGNSRVSGVRNDTYQGVFVFDNDHPCVGPLAPRELSSESGILRARRADGLARVVCYTPRHDLSLAELDVPEIEALCRTWQAQYRELSARPEVEHVLVFENKGEIVGVSNPHPHCQIYATNFVFKTIEIEALACARHASDTGRALLSDVIRAELEDGRRVLYDGSDAVAFVPYFARYAYETFVAPKASHQSIAELSPSELEDLSRALKDVLVRYDNLWHTAFPYVLVLHQAPTDGAHHPGFHFHVQIHPPLRRPNLRKYLAGPEIGGGGFLADTSPEEKAAELRALSTTHYRVQS
jgi:UDPglucose--hexose-1-phosphate uridylyltransferase